MSFDQTPDLNEARRLLDAGMHLVKLERFSKRPIGLDWNAPHKRAKSIDDEATGYGLPLAANRACSVDPDNWRLALRGMAALGFDLEQIMAAGVRTRSTRPGSGGRAAFAEEPDLSWLTFSSRDPKVGTVLELRAFSPNLQDVVPGLVYYDKAGVLCTQTYANGRRWDDLPGLPDQLLDWWQRCSTDIEFLREQQAKFFAAIEVPANLAISTGKGGRKLAFDAPGYRGRYNAANTVDSVLERHGYTWHPKLQRWAPPTATGAPGVRPIPGKDGLWQSDHASDPLAGTFDAWVAHVQLDHFGDVEAAKRAMDAGEFSSTINLIDPETGEIKLTKPPKPNVLSIQDAMAEPLRLDYVVQHILVRGYLYALTANPGAGKTSVSLYMAVTLALGRPFMGRKTTPCRVLFLCGENPQDVRIRTEVMMLEMGVAMDQLKDRIYFTRRPFAIDNPVSLREFVADAAQHGPFDILFIDTGPAHSKADDENDNRAMHELAMAMRDLMTPVGMPCTIALMHPVKGASRENLLPRGGSSFTGSVDGVLCLWSEGQGALSELFAHPQKFRGQHFEPMWFELAKAVHPSAVDNFGDQVLTVVARPAEAAREPADVTELLGTTIREQLLVFLAAIESEHDWIGTSTSGPNANNPFKKSWADHHAYPPILRSPSSECKRATYKEIEQMIKEGLLIREARQTRPGQRGRDFPPAIWLTEKGREALAQNECKEVVDFEPP